MIKIENKHYSDIIILLVNVHYYNCSFDNCVFYAIPGKDHLVEKCEINYNCIGRTYK